MSVRNCLPLAAFAVVLSLVGQSVAPSVAHAEGPVPASAPSPARAPAPVSSTRSAGEGWAMEIFDVTRFVSAPAALGESWDRAVRAVLDSMRTFLESERATVLATAAPPNERPVGWSAPTPARNDVARTRRLVRLQPVEVAPVTQSVADVRGQSAVLLGARVELPWTMP